MAQVATNVNFDLSSPRCQNFEDLAVGTPFMIDTAPFFKMCETRGWNLATWDYVDLDPGTQCLADKVVLNIQMEVR